MSSQKEFYIARAVEARHDADAATLDNVRERCLRAEAAWLDMAQRAGRTEQARARNAADKEAATAG